MLRHVHLVTRQFSDGLLAAALVSILTVLPPGAARAGNPWEELMGPGKPMLWTDPAGRFYLDLPVGWTAAPRKDHGHVVDFWKTHADYGYIAHLAVEIRSVPPNVKLAHFASRVTDEMRAAASGYKLLEADKVPFSGTTAHRSSFTYQERNNAQLTNEVVQLVALVGERAFILTFETALGARAVFAEDFHKMIRSFAGRAPGEDSSPMPTPRKRIRAGEMVNPDAVQY